MCIYFNPEIFPLSSIMERYCINRKKKEEKREERKEENNLPKYLNIHK